MALGSDELSLWQRRYVVWRWRLLGEVLKHRISFARNGAGAVEMVGQAATRHSASNMWREFATSRSAKGFLASAAVASMSAAMTIASAMLSQASAQPFSQALVFGDSSVDSGFYKVLGSPGGGNQFNIAFAAAIAAGGTGAATNTPGLMNSQVLAAYF